MKKTAGRNIRKSSFFILMAILLALAVNTEAQTKATTPSSTDRKAIERLFTAWNSRDVEKVVAAFSKDAIYEDVAAGQVHRGRVAIRKWVAGAFRDIENFKLEVVHTTIYNGGGLVEWLWSGTDRGLMKSGKSFSVRGVSVIEVHRGNVTSNKDYYDFATVMRQLGVPTKETN